MEWWLKLRSCQRLSAQDEEILSRFTQAQFMILIMTTYPSRTNNGKKITVKCAIDWLRQDGLIDATN